MVWQVIAATADDLRCWDKEFVLYDPWSGDTHLLAERSGKLLQFLLQGPADIEQLEQQLLLGPEVGDQADTTETLWQVLSELSASHLIEQV